MAKPPLEFLFDENVPRQLLPTFAKFNFNTIRLQQLGWSGIKNGNLAQKVKDHGYILVTRDKDFTFLWQKYQIQVVYLAIHPATLGNFIPRVETVLANWTYDDKKPFLLMIQKQLIREFK